MTLRNLIIAAFATTAFAANAQTFTGYMAFRSTWIDEGDNRPRCGWYTFDLGHNNFAQHTDDDYVISASKGGTYGDGHYYAMENANDSWLLPDPKFHIYDAATFDLQQTVSYGRSDRDHATKDFAYHPTQHRLYAIAQYRDGNTADGGWLQEYDPSDGTMKRVAHLPFYLHAFSISTDGNFYAISDAGNLYRLTWDESVTKNFKDYGNYPEATLNSVGSTGYRLQNDITYANSLCFEHRTGRLFWAASVYPTAEVEGTNGIVRGIFEIDTKTGAATLLHEFCDNILITALSIPYNGLDCPDDILDLTLTPSAPGSRTINIGFTAPACTYGQTAYPDGTQFDVHICIDGTPTAETASVTAGQSFSTPIQLAHGTHKIGVTLTAKGQGVDATTPSNIAEKSIYVGFDTPIAPEGAKVTCNRELNEATIIWKPVDRGINGGEVDKSTLTYIVTRLSDNGTDEEDVAFGITDCSFTDKVDVPMSYTRYEVTALSAQKVSSPARTSYTHVGQPRELPFLSSFSYVGEFNQFIVIDANGDGFDEWETPSWYFDNVYGAAFCYLNRRYEPQDDWLVTPALKLTPGEKYDIIFQSYGYYGKENAPIHLQIATGDYAEAERLDRVIYDKEYSVPMPSTFPYDYSEVLTENVVLEAREGDRYIGFHNITTSFDHMSIDNIYIRPHEEGSASVLSPELTDQHLNLYNLHGQRVVSNGRGIVVGDGKKRLLP